MRRDFPLLPICLLLVSYPAVAGGGAIRLEGLGGGGLSAGPFAVPLEAGGAVPGAYVAAAAAGDATAAAQVSTLGPWGSGEGGAWVAVSGAMPSGAGDSLVLLPAAGEPVFSFEESDGAIRLDESGVPVFVYHHGMVLAEGVPEDRERGCYFHPVYDPAGRVITDDFPRDHYHHRGMAWMWPGVWIGDRRVDEWHIKGVRQRFVRWLGREAGPVCAVLGIEAGWFLEDGARKAEEVAWYRVLRRTERGRAIDVHYTLRAGEEPMRIQGTTAQEKGYGGLCIRFGPREETRITSPQGLEAKDSDRVPHPWVDSSAKFGGAEEFSGAAILIHPGNPGFPNGWTIRHYGFLGVAWPGLETITLEAGESFTLQYRVWVHGGDAEEGRVEQAWKHYAEPGEPIAIFTDGE